MGFTYGKGNIVSSLRPSGGGAKKWSFFLFSSGKKRPTTRDDAEEGCYCPPLEYSTVFSSSVISRPSAVVHAAKFLFQVE